MLFSITFNFIICFSFSMLLHGLTLGENDGDLEVCDNSLYIYFRFIWQANPSGTVGKKNSNEHVFFFNLYFTCTMKAHYH